MAYSLVVLPGAMRDLEGLTPDLRARVRPKIDSLSENPRPPGVKKLRAAQDSYRVRVGDYRIVYGIDDARKVVTVERVAHRSEVY
ncbi:MAG: type II toxin-antitoxin system RelE/ParE family toxin [Planctomycetales bacterium]|nr:type II toxin-antitoxin system RelE/ParE family toxin [Planctomycetales bacterium]